MDKFNKHSLGLIQKDIEQALKAVSEKHDISFEVGSMRYTDTTIRIVTNWAMNGVNGENGGNAVAKSNWDRYCIRYDLKPSDFGRKFKARNTFKALTLEIVGCKQRSSVYPILGKDNKTGKVYKLPIDQVKGNFMDDDGVHYVED